MPPQEPTSSEPTTPASGNPQVTGNPDDAKFVEPGTVPTPPNADDTTAPVPEPAPPPPPAPL
ncbi:hypothetical protein CH275_16280, partial [Rhodococcus sp. 06-235-1A]